MSKIRIESNPLGKHRYELEARTHHDGSVNVTILQHWLMHDGVTWARGDSVTFQQMDPADAKRLGEFLSRER